LKNKSNLFCQPWELELVKNEKRRQIQSRYSVCFQVWTQWHRMGSLARRFLGRVDRMSCRVPMNSLKLYPQFKVKKYALFWKGDS
jgi:hypothetical protein